jgi:crossover junction endodeoxyribonuclease RusA
LLATIELPWPPSLNTYYRRNGGRYFISLKGMDYRAHVGSVCKMYSGLFPINKRLRLHIEAFPPDKRRRDLDNTLKAICDSLQHANVFEDDSQIDELLIRRRDVGLGIVRITIDDIFY